MRTLIKRLADSPRFWLIFASLMTRGAGFVTALFLSRFHGAIALGSYSTMVNTAAAVATPFSQVLANNATVLGAEGMKKDDDGDYYNQLWRTTFTAALSASFISILIFMGSYFFLQGENSQFTAMLLAAGVFVIAGEVIGVVGSGFLYGAGQFSYPARTTFFIAMLVCLVAYPTVKIGGLGGALVLLIIISFLPPLLIIITMLSNKKKAVRVMVRIPEVRKIVRDRLFRGAPTFLIAIVNNASYWICNIYFVQLFYGPTGVGIIAVAGQWLNFMLIPATSWGSLSLKTLADLILNGDRHRAWVASKDLVKKNICVTLVLAGSIAIFAKVIAWAYGLKTTDLDLIICINALYALFKSVNIVLERFLFALGLQTWWAFFTFLSCAGQLIMTYFLLPYGLWLAPVVTLLVGIFLCILSCVGVTFVFQRAEIAH